MLATCLPATSTYMWQNALFASSFDVKTLKVDEERVALVPGVQAAGGSAGGSGLYSTVEQRHARVHAAAPGVARARPQRSLAWVDRAGLAQPAAFAPGLLTRSPEFRPTATAYALVVGSTLPPTDPARHLPLRPEDREPHATHVQCAGQTTAPFGAATAAESTIARTLTMSPRPSTQYRPTAALRNASEARGRATIRCHGRSRPTAARYCWSTLATHLDAGGQSRRRSRSGGRSTLKTVARCVYERDRTIANPLSPNG